MGRHLRESVDLSDLGLVHRSTPGPKVKAKPVSPPEPAPEVELDFDDLGELEEDPGAFATITKKAKGKKGKA